MARESLWENSDGLAVGFGTHSEDNKVAAVVGGTGAVKTAVMMLEDATDLEAITALTVASFPPQSITIPRGSRILEATFQVTTGFTTAASGVLNIGTNTGRADGAYTADDEDGIDVDIAITALNAIGAVVACDGALVGGVTSCGAAATADVQLCFSYKTGVYTAGAGILTVRYIEPQGPQGNAFLAVE